MKHETSVTYSAPAKVILSGEHAVVYGKPALVSAIDLRLCFSVYKAKESTVDDKNIIFIADLVRKHLRKRNELKRDVSYGINIKSSIPIGRNLGSSAALAVTSVAAFLDFFSGGRTFAIEEVNNIAYQVEKRFHGNPSGIDNSAAAYGGMIFYRKEFEFLKTISSLTIKIPSKIEKRLYLIDSGKPTESTQQMVSHVGSFYNKNPKKTEAILNAIERETKKITVAVVKADSNLFKQAIAQNQKLLDRAGVVSPKTNRLLKELQRFGAGKITGAGGIKSGSGYLLFFAEKPSELESFVKARKIQYLKFKQSHQGLVKTS